jgi:pilus assembly protein CpaB
VVAAIAAVLTGISAAAPEGPAMITVVRAKSQLSSGRVLSASDLVLDRVTASDVPKGVLTNPNDLVGKTLAAPVAENQMMTLLTTTTARTSVPPGHVIAPLRLADSALTALLGPGDVVDVVAADPEAEQPAAVIAAGARVVTVPEAPNDRAGPGSDGALVLIDVDSHTAAVVAQAAASSTLSLFWR